jgi:hypothetical protein
VKAKRNKNLDPAAPLAEGAARIVKVRLRELLTLREEALDEENVDAQHDTRIAAKRLRYVLEATGFCLGEPADAARRAARDLQDLLGEIHDADVMLPRLADHRQLMRDEDAARVRESAGKADDLEPALAGRAPHRTAYRGLEVYDVYLLARRSLLHERFRELSRKHDKRGIWKALDRAADDQLAAAERRREAEERAERLRSDLERAERERREAEERRRAAAEALAAAEREREA